MTYFQTMFMLALGLVLLSGDPIVDQTATSSIPSSLSFSWINQMSMKVWNTADQEDVIQLRPAGEIGGIRVPCLFNGYLQDDEEATVAVYGCQDWPQVEVVLLSKYSDGSMFNFWPDLKITYEETDPYFSKENDQAIVEEDKNEQPKRSKRSNFRLPEEDDYIDIDEQFAGSAVLPESVYHSFSVAYDEALFNKMERNQSMVKQYIAKIIGLAQPYFLHHSIGLKIYFEVNPEIKYLENMEFRINPVNPGLHIEDAITQITSTQPLSIFTFTDDNDDYRGVAPRRGACDANNGRAITKWRSKPVKCARTFAHEHGHWYSLYHDSDEDIKKAFGLVEKCVEEGIMTDSVVKSEKWSLCSQRRLERWFHRAGHVCLKEATRCNNRMWETPCVCGENQVASLCHGQQTICEHSTGTCHDKLPEPIFLIVGQSGSGKSSLARALSGVDPKCRDCQDVFPVCKRGNQDSCTGSTSYRTSPWLGLPNNPVVTIVDTPGFGDTKGRDEEQQTEMMEILNEEVGSANAIILLIKATNTRFLPSLQIMLKKMEVFFGKKMWDHVIISLSFWTYSEHDIECREYDDCPTEEVIKNEINKQLRQHLGLTADLETVFVDILAKRDRHNIRNDVFRQSKFEEEAQKLFDFAKNHDAFEFKTINDIFQENIRMKRQISVLEETLDDNITVLFEEVAHNKAANERCILDISEGLKGIKSDMEPKIEENKKGIQGLKGDISNGIRGLKGDISEGLKGIKNDMGPKIEENTKGIQGLKGDISNGILGLKGDISEMGPKIEENRKGIQGLKGDISEMGPKIEENRKGIQGLKGDISNGIQGLKGDISEMGPKIEENRKGIQGLKGDISKGIQGLKERLKVSRTCYELEQSGVKTSGYYQLDPDGIQIGQPPIKAYCDFESHVTEILHNSDDSEITIPFCNSNFCHTQKYVYTAHMDQITALMELSTSCDQTLEFGCNGAPLSQGEHQFGAWVDRHGEDQVYFDGANHGRHTCSCDSTKTCSGSKVLHNTCNCDNTGVRDWMKDSGKLTNVTALPVMSFKYGPFMFPTQQAKIKVGRLRCGGRKDVGRIPHSCKDLKLLGETRPGLYHLQDSQHGNYPKMSFCQLDQPGYGDDLELESHWVKRSSGPGQVFFAVKHSGTDDLSDGAVITFDVIVANEGQGMNPSSGVFTAPVDGVYDFKLSGLAVSRSTYVDVYLNDVYKVRMYDQSQSGSNSLSRAWQFNLKQGDTVKLKKIKGGLHGGEYGLYFIGILM